MKSNQLTGILFLTLLLTITAAHSDNKPVYN